MKLKGAFVLMTIALLLPATGVSQEHQADSSLIVHEWGTFTSIAGSKGEAVAWLPQVERDDLPQFVEHLRNGVLKGGLRGTVRMETPVLYFHATHPTTVSVHVSFSKGLLTEWYPHAKSAIPPQQPSNAKLPLQAQATDGEITWDSVSVDPDTGLNFVREAAAPSRYYAARETSASPLTVDSPSGPQREKFLFYRGVSSFHVPVSAVLIADGRMLVSNLAGEAIPQAILFERRGEKLGYRFLGIVQNSSIAEPPELDSNLDTLKLELEKTLIQHGLFADEAHAMVETWKDSWFEEGCRLFYIVPSSFVESVLPLTIRPVPANTIRVFVGRMEIVTPVTEKTVETAFAMRDRVTLARYGRFLAPILQTMMDRSSNAARIEQLSRYQAAAYGELFAQQRPAPRTTR